MIKQIAEWIEAQTGFVIGTKLIVGHAWPSEIDRCSILKEHTGSTLYPDLPDRADFMLQVLSRSNTYMTARDDAYTIYNALYKNRKGPINLGTPGGNLVPNGDFENWTAGVLDDWYSDTTAPSTINQDTNPYSGLYCVRFDVVNGNTARIRADMDMLVVGTKYRLSFKYKVNEENDSYIFRFLMYTYTGARCLVENNKWTIGSFYRYIKPNTSWQNFSIEFYPEIHDSRFYLWFYEAMNPGFSASLYFDDVVIQALDEYVAMTCHATTTPQYLGPDERKHHVFSTNYRLQIRDY